MEANSRRLEGEQDFGGRHLQSLSLAAIEFSMSPEADYMEVGEMSDSKADKVHVAKA